jgi:molybdopterin biosynthesis enzyme
MVIPYEQALKAIADTVEPLEKEEVPLSEALDRYLAEDIVAPFAIGSAYDANDVIARSRTFISPSLVSLMAATGRTKVMVYRYPRVGIVVISNDVQPQGEPLELGKVYDATTYMLLSALKSMGIQGIAFGLVSENSEAVRETLRNALDALDIVLACCGGKSGENRLVRDVLLSLDVKEIFWGCAIEPGGNLFFGTRQGHHVFCLPQDPVYAGIVFQTVVGCAVRCALGALDVEPQRLNATFVGEKHKSQRCLKFLLSRFRIEAGGQCCIWNCETGGEYSFRAFANANSITLFPREQESLSSGQVVEAIPLFWKG